MLLNIDALEGLTLVLPPTEANVSVERWTRFSKVTCRSLPAVPESDRVRARSTFFVDSDTFGMVDGYRRDDEHCHQLSRERTIGEKSTD